MRGRILITNNSLDTRGGSELFVRDLALWLASADWDPILFSTRLGEVAREIRGFGISITDDLARMTEAPLLIHGQHHMETAAAVLRFPHVPAVNFCHGFIPWQEAPFRHPNVVAHVVVSQLCRSMLVNEYGIDPARVQVVHNFADLKRFVPRGPLPETISKILVFDNALSPTSTMFRTISAAGAFIGASVSLLGRAAGNDTAAPELVLGDYDVVFATGRSAIEALVSGCAVVVCNNNGMAGLVTPSRLGEMRDFNFALRLVAQRPKPEVQEIVAELEAYDRLACKEVSLFMREQANLDRAGTQIVDIYNKVLEDWFARDRESGAESAVSESEYLVWLRKTFSDFVREITSANEELRQLKEKAGRWTSLQAEMAILGKRLHAEKNRRCALEERLAKAQQRMASAKTRLDRFRGLRRFLPRWLIR